MVRMIQLIPAALAPTGLIGLPPDFPTVDVTSKTNINFAGRTGQGQMAIEISVPKEHVQEIMSIFISLSRYWSPDL